MKHVKFFAIVFILLFVPSVFAAYAPVNYVSDYAEIISPAEEDQINALAEAVEKNSTVEIAVLTVPSLDGQDADSFAVDIFQQWGIGKKDVDNGLLILVAPNEREWRIEVGYGLEPVLTDAMAGRIGREHFTENFRAGEYGKGIYDAIEDISKVIQKDDSVISKYDDTYGDSAGILPFIFLFVFIVVQAVIVFATAAHSKKLHIRLSTAAVMAIILLFLNAIFAIIFCIFALSLLAPWTMGGIGPGGFSGRGLGGFRGGGQGFGGFGGGSSGGGGAGGRW